MGRSQVNLSPIDKIPSDREDAERIIGTAKKSETGLSKGDISSAAARLGSENAAAKM